MVAELYAVNHELCRVRRCLRAACASFPVLPPNDFVLVLLHEKTEKGLTSDLKPCYLQGGLGSVDTHERHSGQLKTEGGQKV